MTANGAAVPLAAIVSQPRGWKLIVEKDVKIPIGDFKLRDG
jgi:hypothetical protein